MRPTSVEHPMPNTPLLRQYLIASYDHVYMRYDWTFCCYTLPFYMKVFRFLIVDLIAGLSLPFFRYIRSNEHNLDM